MEERAPKVHELKCHPEPFADVESGRKPFEVRVDDGRDFRVGDSLCLRQYIPDLEVYTGRWLVRRVTYILRGQFGLPPDVVVMGIV